MQEHEKKAAAKQAVTDTAGAIALEVKELADIIKIESEKLKKVKECCDYELDHDEGVVHNEPYRSYVNVIEAVALLQTSLSHILNLEADKINEVAVSSSVDEIIKANDEIKSNLNIIYNLEQLLLTLLDLFYEMLKKF